jgi:hypothetical protein
VTVLAVRGSSVVGTTGVTWGNTTRAVDGVFGANDATYATFTNPGSSAVGTIDIGGFAVGAIPVGSTLASISIAVRHLNNNAARYTSVTVQGFDGTTAIDTPQTLVISPAAVHTDTRTIPATLTQLKSAGFKIRCTVNRNATASSGVWSLDFIDLTADYTAPAVGGRPKVWTGSAWAQYPAKVWNGSTWTEYPVKTWTGSDWQPV